MGFPHQDNRQSPQTLVVSRETLIRRQSQWLMFWTMVFLVTGIVLGMSTAESETMREGGLWTAEHAVGSGPAHRTH